MKNRAVKNKITKSLKSFPAVALLGARQVGKTTLVKRIAKEFKKRAIYLDLENPSDFEKLSKDAKFFLQQYEKNLVIIDEVQRMPQLFPLLRHLIDENRKNSRFILLGSASKEILQNASESLAGRINYLEMNPFFFDEVGAKKFYHHLLRGGFPRAFLAKNPSQFKEWFDGFTSSYIEKDLRDLGLSASPILIRRLITMLADVNSCVVNYSAIASSLGVSSVTIKSYIEFLEHAFVLRSLTPFFPNISKRFTKSNKIYFRDSGLLNYFLGIYDQTSLTHNIHLGAIFESYVVQQVVAKLNYRTTAHFYRTHKGAEIDLCLVQGNKVVVAIEVKFSSNPTLSFGNHTALQDLGNPDLLVVSPLSETYKKDKKITVVNIKDLENFLKKYRVMEMV